MTRIPGRILKIKKRELKIKNLSEYLKIKFIRPYKPDLFLIVMCESKLASPKSSKYFKAKPLHIME